MALPATEASLEDFIWDHLEELLGFKRLRRQHSVDGNICDILALTETRQLVVIELKNTEDRYVVQQLTRYYHALIEEKPFSDQIDYTAPVILKIISPIFHKDNRVDCSYTKLLIELHQFSIVGDTEPILKIVNLETKETQEKAIPFTLQQKDSFVREIADIPRSFRTALARCPHHDADRILQARERILRFDPRIEEIQEKPGQFIFGKGKSKPCATFVTQKCSLGESQSFEHPTLGLWLPISFGENYRFSRVTLPSNLFLFQEVQLLEQARRLHSITIGRISFCTTECMQLCQKGIGRTQKISQSWDVRRYLCCLLRKELNTDVDDSSVPQVLERYCEQQGLPNGNGSSADLLDFFVELALRYWLQRL